MEKTTVRRMAETFIGIVAEAVETIGMQQTRHNQRHVCLVLAFRRLLSSHLSESRQPSHYASLLNISPVYLNEVVKSVTGIVLIACVDGANSGVGMGHYRLGLLLIILSFGHAAGRRRKRQRS